MSIFNYIRNLFYSKPLADPTLPKKVKPSYACSDHDEDDPPPYCHRCPDRWTRWTKPTIYRPEPDRYDRRLCLDWICEGCLRREIDQKELEIKQYNNTREAAELTFYQEGGVFLYYGSLIEADFPISYESLAPYVTKIIDGAFQFLYHGIDFEAVVIRDGCVYIRDARQEWSTNV